MQRRNAVRNMITVLGGAVLPGTLLAERKMGEGNGLTVAGSGKDKQIKVINAGIGGNNTVDLLQRIEKDCLSHRPDLTVLMIGTNDMNSQKHVPLTAYRQNLGELAGQIRGLGSQLLLMTILPPYEPYLLTRHPAVFYQPEGVEGRRKQYNTVISEVAAKHGARLLDMGHRFEAIGHIGVETDSLLKNQVNSGQTDGVHPTPNGYRFLALSVYDQIRCMEALPKKIVCFGDSITRGDNDANYPGYLARLFALLCFICVGFGLRAQTGDYKESIRELKQIIDTRLRDSAAGLYYESDSAVNENPHSWLWPLCAYIQAANEMEALEKGHSLMPEVEKAIDQYYDDRAPAPAYQDYVRRERVSSRFYDDNQWVAIAYLDAYRRTHTDRYLQKAQLIYRFMLTGMDTVSGGGLYWKEGDKTTKNTCSNGPGIIIALQLYRITKQRAYLDTALSIYRWVNTHLQTPEGLYYDNIKIPSGRIGKALYTYNTGTMLQSNALLYQLTKQPEYLQEAQRIAAAAKTQFVKQGRLPKNYWFNAVLLRGCQELYHIDHDRSWLDIFRTDADAVWRSEHDTGKGVGTKSSRRLIDQAAMIEIYARLEEEGMGSAKYQSDSSNKLVLK